MVNKYYFNQIVFERKKNSFREKRLAKKYYDKLFKEYCICDLSRWEEKKIAMRWRIDKEVVSGKGKRIQIGKKIVGSNGLKGISVGWEPPAPNFIVKP